jgi:hypothetical protein
MRRLTAFFLIMLLLPSLGAADSLYKWVDAQGNIHYSDKPQPGAKKIALPKVATFTPPQVANPATPSGDSRNRDRAAQAAAGNTSPEAAAGGYTAIKISSPADQETLWNTDSVTVTVAIEPNLQPGDSVTITLDGNKQIVAGSSATFGGLDRGQHTITASVGGVNASPITFFLQKTSIQKPPSH